MASISRRKLLQTTTLLGASSFGLRLGADPLGLPIGCQTYPVREMIATDFPGTVKKLAAAGFQRIELCSPKGYADSGFASVGKYKGPELIRLLADMNVQCHSSHFDIKELKENLPATITWAKSVGLKQMMVPSLEGPEHPTMDDVKRAADSFNQIGGKVAAAGMQLGLHNEGFEISTVDGKKTYDVLFTLLDPKLVKFQFQCSEIADGFIAADYFTKYPGRFISMHVQDWNAQAKKEVAIGKGVINWKKTFAAAKVGGVQNYFVEMDLPLMQQSVPYLRGLQV